jgi:hypothetical protein
MRWLGVAGLDPQHDRNHLLGGFTGLEELGREIDLG